MDLLILDPAVNTIPPRLWRIQFNGATKKNHGTAEVGHDLCHSIGLVSSLRTPWTGGCLCHSVCLVLLSCMGGFTCIPHNAIEFRSLAKTSGW